MTEARLKEIEAVVPCDECDSVHVSNTEVIELISTVRELRGLLWEVSEDHRRQIGCDSYCDDPLYSRVHIAAGET